MPHDEEDRISHEPTGETWLERMYVRARRNDKCPKEDVLRQLYDEEPEYVDWDWLKRKEESKRYNDVIRKEEIEEEKRKEDEKKSLDTRFFDASGDTVINIGFNTSKDYVPPDDLIDGVIGKISRNGIVGPSGAGKSFIDLEMSVCVAGAVVDPSIKFMGRDILRPGGAGIFSFESSGTMEPRWRGLVNKYGDLMNDRHGNVRIPFFSVLRPKPLSSDAGWESLEADIVRMQRICRERFDCDMATISVDTVHASQMVDKENDSDAWKVPLAHMLRISEKYRIAFNIVHHSGKTTDSNERNPSDGNSWRGSGSAPAAMDNIMVVKMEKREGQVKRRWVILEKSKDGETGYLSEMQHKVHRIGKKRNGKDVTTLTFDFPVMTDAERNAARADSNQKEKVWKPKKPTLVFLHSLAKLSNQHGMTRQLETGKYMYVAPSIDVEKETRSLFSNASRDWRSAMGDMENHPSFVIDSAAMTMTVVQDEKIITGAFAPGSTRLKD